MEHDSVAMNGYWHDDMEFIINGTYHTPSLFRAMKVPEKAVKPC